MELHIFQLVNRQCSIPFEGGQGDDVLLHFDQRASSSIAHVSLSMLVSSFSPQPVDYFCLYGTLLVANKKHDIHLLSVQVGPQYLMSRA